MVWRVNFVGGDLMYGVPIKYKKGALAQKRQVLGKVIIDYSAPETDSSIIVTANENAHITQNQQVANNIEMPTHKWASLDGTWVLDGTHYLCPDTADAAVDNEMGWWGKNLAGAEGKFIACDIDPPFVGTSFNQAGADPSFCLHDGVLYLVFVDGDNIKVSIVDQTTMAVTSLLRTISAPGASRPRLIFEPSTYSGQADLPHVAYVGSDGKVYGYREQYLEDLSIEAITDEIGVGTSIEALWIGDYFYHFYVDAGIIYVRKQGEYAEVLITPNSGSIISVWAWETPDGRIGFLYSLAPSAGGGDLYNAYSELMFPTELSESMGLAASITAVEYRTGILVFNTCDNYTNYTVVDDGMELTALISAVQLISSIFPFTESMGLNAAITQVLLNDINSFSESMGLTASIIQVILSGINEFTENMQLTASITAVTLEE
jgi:hypothetical protein